MRILITGATGFIGGHLAEFLKTAGHHVEGIIRNPKKAGLLNSLSIPIRIADIADKDSLNKAISEDFDAVINTVAPVTNEGSWEFFRKINVEGTKNLAEAMLAADIKRLIHISTVGIYGQQAVNGDENLIPKRPGWMKYGVTKLEAEEALQEYPELDVTFLRPAFVLGARDRIGILPIIFHTLKKKRFVLIDEGNALTSPVYIRDVCQAVQLSLEKPEETTGQAYNVASPEEVRIKDVVDCLHQELDVPLPEKKVSFRSAYNTARLVELLAKFTRKTPTFTRMNVLFVGGNSQFSSDKLQRLGWQSTRSLKEMIHEWAEWRKNYELEKKKQRQ
ncbi:NAD-dependent epimerase/dehydratase family protein [Acidobacteriota bacterium]